MSGDKKIGSIFFLSRAGCLLPIMIFFNLFFGRLFLPPRAWLIFEGVLILIYLINVFMMIGKLKTYYRGGKQQDVVDVEAEVLKDKPPKDS